MLAVLLAVYCDELPSYTEMYAQLGDLNICVVSEKNAYPCEHLVDGPEKPDGLSRTMYDHAYPVCAPVSVHVVGTNTTADNHSPSRKQYKLLKLSKSDLITKGEWGELRGGAHESSTAEPLSLTFEPFESPTQTSQSSCDDIVLDADAEAFLLEYNAQLVRLISTKTTHATPCIVQPKIEESLLDTPMGISIMQSCSDTSTLTPRRSDGPKSNIRRVIWYQG